MRIWVQVFQVSSHHTWFHDPLYFTNGVGTGGKSVCGEKFSDENFVKTHDKAGKIFKSSENGTFPGRKEK